VRVSELVTTWTFAPAPTLLAFAAAIAYLLGARRVRARGEPWPWWRTLLTVGVALPLLALTVSWWPGARSHELFSAYVTQLVVLALIVPALLVLGAPVRLGRRALVGTRAEAGWSAAFDSRLASWLAHPLVTPLLLLAIPCVVVFTPVMLTTLQNAYAYSAMQVLAVVLGLAAVLGFVDDQVPDSGVPYAAAAFVAFFELILDAIPGIVLFFTTALFAGGWYAVHGDPGGVEWAQSDQRAAGAILWAVGEAVDLPFLIAIVVLWMRADAEEARRQDALLDAQEEAARRARQRLADEP
jgi:putative copper resistance protein D